MNDGVNQKIYEITTMFAVCIQGHLVESTVNNFKQSERATSNGDL